MSSPYYPVFRIASLGAPRDHHAIFIEDGKNGTGRIFNVTGNIQSGMVYEERSPEKPEDSETFVSKEQIGIVSSTNYARVSQICIAIPPPAKQFDGPKRLVPKDQPLRRCQEWTEEAVQALRDQAVLEKVGNM